MARGLQQAGRYGIRFMVLSFLGWAAETLFFFLLYGRLCDRGFLTLPFCTIYGFSFLLLYFLLGVPGSGQGGLLPGGRAPSLPVYFLLSALIPTGLELITGVLFHRVFGIRLWSYAAYRFHVHGYICLEYTLLWGILLPPAMRYLFLPLKNWVFALPAPWVRTLAAALLLPAAVDWAVSIAQALG